MTREVPRLLRALAFLVVIGVLASCSAVGTTPVSRDLGDPVTATTGAPASTSTSTTVPSPLVPPVTLPLASDVLITRSGVVVAILEHTGRGFRVRTPCGEEAIVSSGTPVGAVQVVLDPGHGGAPDPGAPGGNGLTEAEVNLAVARRARAMLEARGVAALLTRTADYATPLGVRALLADHANADLMVSIHHNAPTHLIGDDPGTEVFVQNQSLDSRRLGGLLYEEITSALRRFDIDWSYAPDAGVLEVLNPRGTDAYGMLRTPETVTALAELAYISHRPEADLMATPEYVETAAGAVADAIVAYLETEDAGSGFVAEPRVFTPQRGISSAVCEDPELG